MKKLLALVLALVMVFCLCACGSDGTDTSDPGSDPGADSSTDPNDSNAGTGGDSGSGDGEEDREWMKLDLTYATFLAADAPSQTQIDMFIEKVNERMDGAITITTYANGSMLSSGDTFNGISTGVADIGFLLTSTCVGQLPLTLLCDSPGFYYTSGTAGAHAMYDYMKWVEQNSDEFEDIVVLTVLALAPQCFSTNVPIQTMDDLKGLQLYCPASFTEAIQRWGATPSTVATSEIYEAVRNGLVDGTCRSVGAAANGMMDEITTYATVCPLLGQSNMMIMNRDVFESMPDYQQELFLELWEEVQREFVDYMLEDFTYGNDVISQEFVKNIENFEYLPQETIDEMYEAVKDLPEQYAADLDAQGLPGSEALEYYSSLVEKYNAEYPTDENIYLKWRN